MQEEKELKKQGWILIGITSAFLCLMLGIFIGRSFQGNYIPLNNLPTQQIRPTQSDAPLLDGKININTATLRELQLLPGVGEAIAQRIIDYREINNGFETIEDLMRVEGIGEKKFEQMKPYIKAE